MQSNFAANTQRRLYEAQNVKGGHHLPHEGEVNEVELLRQQVSDHQRVLEEHTEILKRHSERLQEVSDVQKRHDETIQEMSANYLKLENVIYRENKETRDMMRGTMDKQFSLIEALTGYKESAAVRDIELKKVKTEKWSDIIVKVIGLLTIVLSSGGILFAIVNAFLTK